MRLSQKLKKRIINTVYEVFGRVDIYLFGSRVDDEKRGGDIDLALDIMLSKKEFRRKKAAFYAKLVRMDFLYDVDLVSFHTKDTLLQNEIQNHHIKLT